MGSPSKGDVHISVPLSNLSISLSSPAFKGQSLLPEFFVTKEADKYYTWTNRESLRRINTKRAMGDPSREVDVKPGNASFDCQEYALSKILPDRLVAIADSATNLRMHTVAASQEWVERDLESDIIFEVTQNGGLTGSTPTVKWDATSGTIVIEDNLDTAKQAIEDNAGAIANTIVFNTKVKDAVKTDSTLRDLIRYTITGTQGKELLISGELPPVMFGLRIEVAGAVENTANIGATSVISKVWPNSAIIAFVDPAPSLESKTLGLTFTVKKGGNGAGTVKTWRDEKRNGTFYEVSMIKDPVIVASSCGYNFHSVLT